MISLLILLLIVNNSQSYNDYPSLITANATMAVVIEKSFLKDESHYQNAVEKITNTINNVIHKWMKVGGIDVKIFSLSGLTLGRDFTVLFSIATCQWTWVLFKQARKERLVHIAITGEDCPRLPDQEGISIPLINPGHELPQLFLDLRVSGALSWKKINILYDTSFQRDSISKVLKALSIQLPNRKLEMASRSLFAIKYDKDELVIRKQIRKTLSDFQFESLGNCFMIIVKVDMVIPMMEVARSLRMVHPGNQWLYILSDVSKRKTNITALTQRLIEGENIAFIYNDTKFNPSCESGLFCHLNELIKSLSLSLEISYQSEFDLFSRVTDEEFETLRLSKEERVKEIIENVNKALIEERSTSEGNCGKCLSWRIGSAITWGNSFDSTLAGKGQLIHSGSWSPGPGSNLSDTIFPHIDYGFRGKTLPIITYHNPPWQIVEYSSNGVPKYEGLTFDIIQELSKQLNFTYQVILATSSGVTNAMDNSPRSNASKRLSDNSNYEGSGMSVGQKLPESILQMTRNNKVFFAACTYTVYENTKMIINYTIPISVQIYTLLAPKPKILSRALLFIAPFSSETWACLSSTIIIIGLLLYLANKYSRKPTIITHEVVGLNTPYQCVWYVYGALLQQGGMNLPQEDSPRLIVGTWWLGVMVFVATYSGSLVAFLTFPRMDSAVSTIDDLLERSSEFTWGFPNGSFLEDYLENTDDEKYLELLSKAERHNSTNDISIVTRVREGNHVLIDWRSSLKYLMRKDLLQSGRCHFSLSSEDFISEPIAMMISKDSPYLLMINRELKRMHESGLIEKWMLERMPLKDQCWEGPGNNQEVENHKVNMGDMQGIFFVLAIGFIIATILIGCEFGWHLKEEAHERKLIRPFVT